MKTKPEGMLLVWTDADPAAEEDFNAWYDAEHLPERVGIPGFLTGRRYRAQAGNPRYFAAYHTENTGVLFSQAYLHLVNNPTPWTQRIMPKFQNTVRSVCSIVRAEGQPFLERQNTALTLRFNPAPGKEAALREAVSALVTPSPGVARISLCEAAKGDQGTGETALRGPDEVAGFALLLEGAEAAPLEAAAQASFPPEKLIAMGAEGEILRGTYGLLLAMDA